MQEVFSVRLHKKYLCLRNSIKKYYPLIILFWAMATAALGQDQKLADSLRLIYHQGTSKDTIRLELLLNLSFNEVRDLQQALKDAGELIMLSQQAGNDKYLRAGYFIRGTKQRLLGNLDEALEAFFKSAEVAQKLNQLTSEGDAYGAIADIYSVGNNHSNATYYYNKAIIALRQSHYPINLASALFNAGDEFRKTGNYDSALLYFTEADSIFNNAGYLSGKGYSIGGIGMVYAKTGQNDLAVKDLAEAIRILDTLQDYYPVCDYLNSLSDVYIKKGDEQTALECLLRSLTISEKYGLNEQIADVSLKLSELYEKKGSFQSLGYYKNYIAHRDSINNIKTVQRMADLRTNYEVSQKQIEVNMLNQRKQNQKNLLISLGIILFLTLMILIILLRNNQHKQRAYGILNQQKQETDRQKAKVEEALTELQTTQKQLIQSAKMASLGELTAGIAHELQNPLNFVNNFSEVSAELLGELKEGTVNKLTVSEKNEASEIIKLLTDNLEKINHHGKRAESIVKGMLQHSRISTNKKELVLLNPLLEEYLRLSYHGLRAKDNTFSITIETSLDNNIENLLIVPQDIGRVMINLYNNAFYSLYQKNKLNVKGYEPKLWLTTKRIVQNGQLKGVQISVRDNGMGIPDKILDKIFQPFFTTKPAGQGTGLGLSLSYDIITNEHKGGLKVETKEGEFAEFVIELPNKDVMVSDPKPELA